MLWHCSLLERDLISLRTKEALSAKRARGQILGKPKGTLQKSKELLGYGLSVKENCSRRNPASEKPMIMHAQRANTPTAVTLKPFQ